MERRWAGDGIKTGWVASLLGRGAARRAAKWPSFALLWVGVIAATSLLHAQSRSVSATLVVQVSEASLVEQQNDNVVIKLRLAPGVAANFWGGESCTTAGEEPQIITASGTYTIPLNQIDPRLRAEGGAAAFICLRSSDGALRRSLPIRRRASLPRTTADPAKSPSESTWSGSVSIPAARVQ